MGDVDAGDRLPSRRKSLMRRWFRLKGVSCCGASWGLAPAADSLIVDDGSGGGEEVRRAEIAEMGMQNPPENESEPECTAGSGTNLAAALEAERQYRAAVDGGQVGPSNSAADDGGDAIKRPATRMSLMRLLEETDGGDAGEMQMGGDSVCCVCMGRKKGAAFIPCGHTFCRVCSTELRLNRGCCPLCNTLILEILHIY
ncbi:unnamed protein product [Cuscuta epithymum]|uniref:RING-type domain-containing protein n=1 Tax=Cuscuta epithymum TaxID=186058 RepID=A0AAV0EQR0_9ASTE|nr:unnamed protein product [Cuscuta epithymum]